MGLFSSKTKTQVGTVVSRVVPDDAVPNSVRTGVLKSLFDDDGGDIPGFVMEELVQSIGLKANRMYEYGQETYTYGVPSGQVYTSTQGQSVAQGIINTLEGQVVLLDYYRFGPPNNLHIAWKKLIAQQGYNLATNQLSVQTTLRGFPTYLKDMQIVVPATWMTTIEPAALEQWGPPATAGVTPLRPANTTIGYLTEHSSVQIDATVSVPYAKVFVTWRNTTTKVDYDATITISLSGYDDTKDYFQARYRIGGQAKYWMYEAGAGTYPTLDEYFDDPVGASGLYFPIAYFRYNKVDQSIDTGAPAYLTSKKLVKYLGMDFDQLSAAINANPDIADVEQAMLMMAVPAVTTNELERRYLFDYFDGLFYAGANQYRTRSEATANEALQQNQDLNKNTIVIRDARFKMALSNGGITKKRTTGVVSVGAAIGDHHSGFTEVTIPVEYVDAWTGSTVASSITVKVHFYKRQITETLYDEIQVYNLQMVYHIIGEYTTTGDDEDDILLIPLDRSITMEYSAPQREELYSRSLHYVFNSVVVTKVKWYQQAWFSKLIIVVAIVITIFTYGAAWEAVAAAIAAGTMTFAAVLMAIAIGILKYLIVMIAVKLFVKAVGVEAAMIIAIIAAAYGIYDAYSMGGLAGAPFAQQLLSVSTNLAKGVSNEVATMMADLMGEASDFTKYVEEQTKTLDKAKDLLEDNNFLSPFVIFGESPDAFFNRTVHSGNIGVVGIDAISSYTSMALTLPTIQDTLGD